MGQYKDDPLRHPETITKRRTELENFMTSCHEVTLVILRVLGKQLSLESDLLPNLHKIDRPSGDQARITFAPPVKPDVITLGEHSGKTCPFFWCTHTKTYKDFGSVTVLFNQLGGLQVIDPMSSEWKYVRPQPGGLC